MTISSGSTVTALNDIVHHAAGDDHHQRPTATLPELDRQLDRPRTQRHRQLTGGGMLAMSNSPNNRIYGSGSDTLINDTSNTIQGSGQIGINNGGYAFTLTNKGTINANQSAALQIAPTNGRHQQRHARGHRRRHAQPDGTFNNTASGLILSSGSGSVVNLNGARSPAAR